MSEWMSGPPLDASGVLTWKLLDFLASQRPSAQEKRGDRRLDDARQLARENERIISAFSNRGRVTGVALSLCRIYLGCKDAFPTPGMKDDWREACAKTGANLDSFPPYELFAASNIKLFIETKERIMHAVEALYGFDCSHAAERIRRNATLAQALLSGMAFIYRERGSSHHPYRHPVLQKAINLTWFRNEDDDGVVFHEYFSPLSVPAIAFILAVIECCIDEWTDGTCKDTKWGEEQFKTAYQSHINSLNDFWQHDIPQSADLFEHIRSDLLKGGRKHAGVPPVPVTGSGRFFQDALDATHREDWDPRAMTIRKQLGAKIKPKIATLVENMYNFKMNQASASISHNAGSAQELLTDLKFIYPDPRRDPYRHPIIQRAIDTTWFRHKDDIGVADHEQFSLMPISIIAITLTVIEWCIVEWSDGTRRDTSWDGAKFQTVYDSHVSSLHDFQAHSPASLYQLQCDLLRNGREHAGVPPDPVTGSSMFSPGALDAVQEDNQPSPTAPPDYYDTMGPRIIIDRA